MNLLAPISRVCGRVVQRGRSIQSAAGTRYVTSLPPGNWLIAGLVVPLLLSSSGVGLAQTVDTNLWVTNGRVNSVVSDGSTIYIGGSFTHVGPAMGGAGATRNNIAALDATTGAATPWNPNANGEVYAIAVSGSTIYAGGLYTSIGGQPRNNIAALDAATGAATAWNPNASSYVEALAVSGSTVYAGGQFITIGGLPRSKIAAV